MKELSIEEKAQAYDEALERAKSKLHYSDKPCFVDVTEIFPELKESEDEKIKKWLIEKQREWLQDQERGGYMDNENLIKTIKKSIAWLEKQGKPQDKGEISDGYHTFNELYYYRMLYNAAFFNMLPKEWVHKSKKHHDGEECFGGGWFIVIANLPTGQVSNHYKLKDWGLFDIQEKEIADEWDEHSPQEAADRLHKYLLKNQGEQKFIWSEEDEKLLNSALWHVKNSCGNGGKNSGEFEVYNLLKSLKDRVQPQWNPSEEQMQTLHAQLNEGAVTYTEDKRVLSTLYKDLMNIMSQEEKQDKKKETLCDKCRREQPSHSCQDITELGRCALEKQGEKKPADKVEPEFKIEKGKWYVCNNSRYKDFVIGKAYYCPKDGMLKPNENEMARYVAKNCFHLWTIKDAKDGDVLYCKKRITDDSEIIMIYEGISNNVDSYCRYSSKSEFNTYITNVLNVEHDSITPATKEQRDLLFSKMKESGCEWDSEKKELKRI